MPSYPHPVAGELTLYLLGPGVGESLVLCLPGGETVVVDCCVGGGTGTLDLLQDLGRPRVDLLLLTHPDLDHVNGLDALLEWLCAGDQLGTVWTWPHLSLMRDLLRLWGGAQPAVQALDAAFSRLDSLARCNSCLEVTINNRDFKASKGALVSVLAPVPADVSASRRSMKRIIELDAKKRPKLTDEFVERLLGLRPPDDHPNAVSIAAAIQWGPWKMLLGGDVESGHRRWRGWQGVLDELRKQDRLDVVTTVDVVKVSHHGSTNAMSDAAWALHTRACGKVKLALVAPFTPADLPKEEGLRTLLGRAAQLGVPSDSCEPKALAAGWVATPPQPAGASAIVVRLRADGSWSLEGQGEATIFSS